DVFGATYIHELCRVLVHGLLHLSGYNDKTKAQKEAMRQREEFHLGALFE
ncbi:MAG: rRNA maturation RNAse YbeY, partial [Bacteroidia bacterium]|nr:rRNA maturation RNAse YbeY [Bacteroidia bacterium]